MLLQKRSPSTSPLLSVLWIVLGVIIVASFFSLTLLGLKKGYYSLIVFASIICLAYYSEYKQKYQEQVTRILLGVLLGLILMFIYHLALTYLKIPQWDFLCLYLFGKVGHSGSNFYDPAVFARFFHDLNLHERTDATYVKEIVNVGFWYPTPSMFFFLPLGMLSLKTGYIIWQTVISIILVIDIVLLIKSRLWQLPVQQGSNYKVFLLCTLIFLFPDLTSSIQYSQTISLFLLLLILLLRHVNNWRSGVCLALLVIVKPLAAIFVLYFLLFKKWKPMLAFALTGALVVLATIVFFGIDNLLGYFASPPTSRIPFSVYEEGINQSLYSVLIRFQEKFFGTANMATIKILFYALGLFLVVTTIYVSRVMYKRSVYLAFLIFVPLALMVYPASLEHYGIMLLPVVLFIFMHNLVRNTVWNLTLVFIFYGLGRYSMFALNLALWTFLATWPLWRKHTDKIHSPASFINQVTNAGKFLVDILF